MNERELREQLQQEFELGRWKQIIEACFPERIFYAIPKLPDKKIKDREAYKRLAKHVHHIGEVKLSDDTNMALIDVQLNEGATQLTRNHVGLRKLVDSEVIAGVKDAAFIVYHQPDYDEWRLSFYSEQYAWDDKDGIIKEETNPKRYTFVVGGDESCRTAAQQLHLLIEHGEYMSLKTILEAFSVEKVSKRFFDEYKHQYDKFVSYLTGKVWTKDGEQKIGDPISQFYFFFKATSDHEKEARDFVKKLLGRIIFLYFVQKKGWLGASSESFYDGSNNFISELFEEVNKYGDVDNFYSQWLRALFFDGLNIKNRLTFTMPDKSSRFIPYLNGGLFEKDETDKNTDGLILPAWLFHNPDSDYSEVQEDKYDRPNKRGFLDFLNAFNFTIHEDSPGDHTIAVDPEMLGHIFENLLEDNKEKGAYYTPKTVVHYMCQESLIEYLNTQLSGDEELRSHIEALIKNQETGGINHLFEEILTALKKVKICDPAIGSGAFPMGLLQEIYLVVENIDFISHDDVRAIWEIEDIEQDRAKIKKQIIQNSIYGVDIEQGAVDIARLRFWLSLIVDEDEPTPLPNLDYKIVSGNSLVSKLNIDGAEEIIEINWNSEGEVTGTKEVIGKLENTLEEIVQKQKKFFDSDKTQESELKKEIKNLKIDALIYQLMFDWIKYENTTAEKGGAFPIAKDLEHNTNRKLRIAEYSETIKKLKSLKVKESSSFNHFEWKLDFPEVLNPVLAGDDAGFDIIIANPPYLGESGNKEIFRAVRQGALSEYYMGKMDYFYFFLHLALNLAVDDAPITFITTNYYPTADGAENLRNDLKDRSRFLKLINFNEYKIFDSAKGQHNMISILKKTNDNDLKVEIAETKRKGYASKQILKTILDGNDGETIYRNFKSLDLFDGPKNYIRLIGTAEDSENLTNIILNRIKEKKSELLGDLCNINQGMVSGCDTLTNRHIDKISNQYDVELGDGIFVFDLTNHRDIQVVDSFNGEERKLLKPFFKNSEINKFSCNEEHKKLLLYLDRRVDSIDKYPNVRSHLNRFREILEDRREVRQRKINYFELQWPRTRDIFVSAKICVPYRVKNNCFAYNNIDWFCRSDCYLITKNDNKKINLKYLLALLNSSLYFFWLYFKGKRKGETLELFYTPLSEIPIYLPDYSIQQDFINLAKEIESLKKEDRDTSELELMLDIGVSKLYNLTHEEASHVLAKKELSLSQEEYDEYELSALT